MVEVYVLVCSGWVYDVVVFWLEVCVCFFCVVVFDDSGYDDV